VKEDQAYIKSKYGSGYRGASTLYAATSEVDYNLMNLNSLELMWDAHEIVTTQVMAGTPLEWKHSCAIKYDGNCVSFGVLQYFYSNRTYYNEVVHDVATLRLYLSAHSYPTGQEVNRDQIYGIYTVEDDQIVSFEGTTITYSVDLGSKDANKWERDFINLLEKVENTIYAKLYFLANRSLSDVFGAAILGDVILTSITYILMVIVTILVLAKKYTWSESRTALGLSGILTVIFRYVVQNPLIYTDFVYKTRYIYTEMCIKPIKPIHSVPWPWTTSNSMVAGYGLCLGLGVKFVPLHQVLPFVVIGIG
jgi:hypothetical protein